MCEGVSRSGEKVIQTSGVPQNKAARPHTIRLPSRPASSRVGSSACTTSQASSAVIRNAALQAIYRSHVGRAKEPMMPFALVKRISENIARQLQAQCDLVQHQQL